MGTASSAIQKLRQELLSAASSHSDKLKNFHLLIVDDEIDLLPVLEEDLAPLGLGILKSNSPEEALKICTTHASTLLLILSDFKMPSMDGLEFRQKVREIAPDVPFAILSAYVDREMALKGLELKISAFFEKPFQVENLEKVIAEECCPRLRSILEEKELLYSFLDDAEPLAEQIESALLSLAEEADHRDTLNSVFGMVHTIKGSSGFFEPKNLHQFAHAYEDYLKRLQNANRTLNEGEISSLLQGIDVLKNLIAEFRSESFSPFDIATLKAQLFENQATPSNDARKTPPTSGEAPRKTAAKNEQALRVELSVLDDFLRASGEMTVVRNMINKIAGSIERRYQQDKDIQQLGELLEELHKINSHIQQRVTELRKVSVKNALKALPRLVRDVSAKLSKNVDLEMRGADIRIDTTVAEILSQSTVHLIRNSLDHGIEKPDERTAHGKAAIAKIMIEAEQKDDKIHLRIQDDGRGIDPEKIAERLVKNGSHTREQISKMPVSELQNMIFSPGFSTAEKVTDISGRGVGMGAVVESLEKHGGRLHLQSEVGQGTLISMEIPVPKSILIKSCLFGSIASQEFAIPQDQIIRILELDLKNVDQIRYITSSPFVKFEGQLIPLIDPSEILKRQNSSDSASQKVTAVVLRTSSGQHYTMILDHISDFEDTVIKTGDLALKGLEVYAGATYLANGTVGLVLNVDGMAELAELKSIPQKMEKAPHLQLVTQTQDVPEPYLIFSTQDPTLYAFPLSRIFRIEEMSPRVPSAQLQYRDSLLQLLHLSSLKQHQSWDELPQSQPWKVLVTQYQGHHVGLIVDNIVDFFTPESFIENPEENGELWKKNFLYNQKLVTLVDIDALVEIHIQSPSDQEFESETVTELVEPQAQQEQEQEQDFLKAA